MKTIIKLASPLVLVLLSIVILKQQALSQDLIMSNELPIKIFLPMIQAERTHPCSVPPTLIAPVDGSMVDTLSPTFRWNTGTDSLIGQMYLQVAIDPEFYYVRESLMLFTIPGEVDWQFSMNFEPGITFYWRVSFSCQDDTVSPYSVVWSFKTPADVDILPAPTLLSPLNGSTVESCPVTLRWEPVDGAVKYRLRYSEGDIDSFWSSIEITDSEYHFQCQWFESETITWAVRAIGTESISDESTRWTFITPPEITGISSPLEAPQFYLEEDGTINKYEAVTPITEPRGSVDD